MANLEWLVVRDFFEIESAAFWKESPEIENGLQRTTEILFLPAADHSQKNGSYANTQRLLQWHHKRLNRRATAAQNFDFTPISGGVSRPSLHTRAMPKTSRFVRSPGIIIPKVY